MERSATARSNRVLLVIGGVLVVFVVVAGTLTLLRGPAMFEPGTPEAVVQEYIEAILDDDVDAAWDLLGPDMQRRCEPEDLEPRYSRSNRGGIVLIDVSQREDTATVELEFNVSYGDEPFDLYESSYRQRFGLRKVDEAWRISDVPWPFDWCSR